MKLGLLFLDFCTSDIFCYFLVKGKFIMILLEGIFFYDIFFFF